MPKARGGSSGAVDRDARLNAIASEVLESLPASLKNEVKLRMEDMKSHNAPLHEDLMFALDDTATLTREWIEDGVLDRMAGIHINTANMWIRRSREARQTLRERFRDAESKEK